MKTPPAPFIRARRRLLAAVTLAAVHCTLPLPAEVSPSGQPRPEASVVAAQPVPELDRLTAALGSALGSLEPPATFTRESATTLRVSQRVQTFLIHDRSMDGRIAPEAREEVGPSHQGFVLFAEVQPAGTVNQADTPQLLRRPYWETWIEVSPLPGSDRQVYWGLSYGSRADTNLLAKIKAVLGGPGGPSPRAP